MLAIYVRNCALFKSNFEMIATKQYSSKTVAQDAEFIEIENYERLPPFFMSLVSRDNLWTYISSLGSLSAGRESEDKVIFPYVTVDKIHDSYGVTGPRTLIEMEDGTLWEPFSPHVSPEAYSKRVLAKKSLSNCIRFTERSRNESITFSYSWQPAGRFGLARRVHVENHGPETRRLNILDGITNIMPPKIDARMQATRSTLIDAYKQSELLLDSRMAVFSTASGITDRPFPMENLYANCAWSCGLPEALVTLAVDAAESMRGKVTPKVCRLSRGQRGAYWLNAEIELAPGESREWLMVLDCEVDAAELAARCAELDEDPQKGKALIEAAIAENSSELRFLLAQADALQCSKDHMNQLHHTANALFNAMRGGVFFKNYSINGEDLRAQLKAANPAIHEAQSGYLKELSGWLDYETCRKHIEASGDFDLMRLFLEYLPITFSRRHGDPSRPWNKFMIRTHDSEGAPILAYQGNWRDIFQNWEALCISYPGFLEHVVTKLLNTSTMDGYNPYRVFNGSFDWEEVDPDDPFSGIGYWGDHQIVYLLRLLEALNAHDPEVLEKWLEKPLFVYANVPYRIKDADAIFENPRSTLVFDTDLSAHLRQKAKSEGYDGQLLKDKAGQTQKATLREKLLIPALVKLSNFVPRGGIWMNTERPEWNDANNALVGNGLSMVTTGHLLRYLSFCRKWWSQEKADTSISLSSPVAEFLLALLEVFDQPKRNAIACVQDDSQRAQATYALSLAGQKYRKRIYDTDFSESVSLPLRPILKLLEKAEEWLQISLEAAKRPDGLIDSYNLLSYTDPKQEITVHRLYEMLEGQVSALSAEYLSSMEAVTLVDRMFESALYTADRNSFLLYPDRRLSDFMDKGLISEQDLNASKLLKQLIETENTELVKRDTNGRIRFAAGIENMEALELQLKTLSEDQKLAALIQAESPLIHSIYEKVFCHHSFTGRSGGMFSFEGLGCIYWHQVSKLMLAVQECFYRECESEKPKLSLQKALGERYYKIREGIGFNKTAEAFGAFPTDPYSHTPAHSGAQQPGMTGQAKEEIITRFGELGIRVKSGVLRINPQLLKSKEFLSETRKFKVIHTDASTESITLNPGELAFTYCQVPFIYRLDTTANAIRIETHNRDAECTTFQTDGLPAEIYQQIALRRGTLRRVVVTLPESLLLA